MNEAPELKEGEIYIGTIINADGTGNKIVLLPRDKAAGNWQDAMDWAKQQGGELPNRVEQAILFANFKDQFKEDWYWSSKTRASHEGYAWCQSFLYGSQGFIRKSYNLLRARAIRRVPI